MSVEIRVICAKQGIDVVSLLVLLNEQTAVECLSSIIDELTANILHDIMFAVSSSIIEERHRVNRAYASSILTANRNSGFYRYFSYACIHVHSTYIIKDGCLQNCESRM
jgi:hypothetical protein